MPLYIRRMDTEGRVHAPLIPPVSLPMYGFMFLTGGQVFLEAGGRPVLVHSGEFLLIPPGIPFSVKYYQDSKGFTGGFREDFLKDASFPVLRETEPAVRTFVRGDALFIGEILGRILEAFDESLGEGGSLTENVSYLKSGLDFVIAHLRKDEHGQGSSLTERFIDMVFDRSRRLAGVSSYAADLGVGADLLNHHVRRYSNHSASEWIAISRLALSRSLLLNTEMSVSEVSDAVGLDDPSYFTRFFRSHEGLTPSAFRKKYSKKS